MRRDIQLSINGGRFRSAFLAERLVDFILILENFFGGGSGSHARSTRRATDPKRIANSAKKDAARKREKRTVEERNASCSPPGGQETGSCISRRLKNYICSHDSQDLCTGLSRLGMLYEKLAGQMSDNR